LGLGAHQEPATARLVLGVVLEQIRLILQQSFAVQAGGVLAALPGHRALGEGGLAGQPHGLLDALLESGLPVGQSAQGVTQIQQFIEVAFHGRVIRKVHGFPFVLRVEGLQGVPGRVGAIRVRWGVRFHQLPELSLQLVQVSNQSFIPLDTVNLKLLPADQHGHIGSLLTGNRQLMLHLTLDVLGNPVRPQLGAVLPRGLALQYLHVVIADDSVIQVGQHPGLVVIRVLQHGIHAPYFVAGDLAVSLGHLRLQQGAPVQGGLNVIGIRGG